MDYQEIITTSIARTLLVTAYADAYENRDLHRVVAERYGYKVTTEKDGEEGPVALWSPYPELDEPETYDSESEAWEDAVREIGYEIPRAGAGQDWSSLRQKGSPRLQAEARAAAEAIVLVIAQLNGCSITELLQKAAEAESMDWDPIDHDYVVEFGYCLAMQQLGYGVAWSDDHEDIGIKFGLSEFYPEFTMEDLKS